MILQSAGFQLPVAPQSSVEAEVDDEMVKNIDLELDKEEAAEKFAAEPETNMWDNPTVEADDEEDDTPAFLRRRKKNKE